jgi:LPXTG-motif cell wall-anchored protein
MADPCAAQLASANSCVSGDPGTCSCFTQPFMESFPTEVSGAYRKTMAFEVPGTPEFCAKANFNVCTQFETTGSCCCGKEVTEYTKCTFTSTLNGQFGVTDCEHTGCGLGGAEAAGGGGSMMMIIIVIVVLLGGGGGFYYYRRRKRLAALGGKDVDTKVRIDGWMDRWMDQSIIDL